MSTTYTEYNIQVEDPYDHWQYVDVANKIVLDLGCGFWAMERDLARSTPKYFLDNGAKFVIGIDITLGDIEYYNSLNLSNAKFELLNINSKDVLMSLINKYNPQVIKMDIEGNEKILFDLNADDIKNIESIAIKYHSNINEEALINLLTNLGLTTYKVGKMWIAGVGVVFAKRV